MSTDLSSRTAALAVCLTATLMAGCTTLDVPRADNYPATGQKKARAVHHWDVLARDVADRVASKMAAWPESEQPVHVTATQDSAFDQSFVKLLRVHLLERGVALSTGPSALALEVQAQLVQHQAPLQGRAPLPVTALGTGVGVWRDWDLHYASRTLLPGAATAIGMGAGLAIDLMQMHTQGRAAGGPTRTEVLITTTLSTRERYLAGSADLYYIEYADASLYRSEPPVAVPVTPVRTWKVVTP